LSENGAMFEFESLIPNPYRRDQTAQRLWNRNFSYFSYFP